MKLSAIVHDYRTSHRMSMDAFGKKAGLSRAYICMIERGKHPQSSRDLIPSIETLDKLAAAMNISLDELVSMLDSDTDINISPSVPDEYFSLNAENKAIIDDLIFALLLKQSKLPQD